MTEEAIRFISAGFGIGFVTGVMLLLCLFDGRKK